MKKPFWCLPNTSTVLRSPSLTSQSDTKWDVGERVRAGSLGRNVALPKPGVGPKAPLSWLRLSPWSEGVTANSVCLQVAAHCIWRGPTEPKGH